MVMTPCEAPFSKPDTQVSPLQQNRVQDSSVSIYLFRADMTFWQQRAQDTRKSTNGQDKYRAYIEETRALHSSDSYKAVK